MKCQGKQRKSGGRCTNTLARSWNCKCLAEILNPWRNTKVQIRAPPAEAELVELADVERKIAAARIKLQEASSYGGGVMLGVSLLGIGNGSLDLLTLFPVLGITFPLP